MTPRRQCILRNAKPSFLAITAGRCLHQTHDTGLTETIEMSVAVNQRAPADTSIAPGDLTGVELHGSQDRARETVQVVSDHNGTAVVVAHVFRKVALLRFAIRLDLDDTSARSIIRRNKP